MVVVSGVSKVYVCFWMKMLFMLNLVSGFGFFVVNCVGCVCWGKFFEIILDDMYVCLYFIGCECIVVFSFYVWFVVEGWENLIKVCWW